ncbi:MAG TPA: energy transducer TonB [Candidatus Acidoferrales bacterium]|nr:energy transducer TonB [Candidatus Acidoferrales bacterium]
MDEGLHNSHFGAGRDALRPRRHLAAFCASITAHVALIAAIVFFASPIARPGGDRVLAYFVDLGDGATGAGANGENRRALASIRAAAALTNLRIGEKPRASASAARRARVVVHDVEPTSAEVASIAPVAASSAARATRASSAARDGDNVGQPQHRGADSRGPNVSAGSGDTGNGAGDGNQIGDGISIAHADYARNPPPAYPAAARRRAEQGVVTIRVLVGDDGRVERAELAESSGYDALDDAALATVRERWRFIPARRAGLPIESWVLVPIRFALTEASAAR